MIIFWFNFLNEASVEPALMKEHVIKSTEVDGLKIRAPEYLVIELLKGGSTSSISDVVSVLVSRDIQWKKLVEMVRKNGFGKELGVILGGLENELRKEGRRLVPENPVAGLSASGGPTARFETCPKDVSIGDDTFSEVGRKWHLKFFLSRETIRKHGEDVALAKA